MRHTVPLGKGVAKLIMVHFASWGFLRLGIGVILQTETGLRPSELLRLRPEDFLFPEEEGSNLRVRPLRIGLGIRGGTKVKRAQFVLLDKRCWRLVRVLRVLKLSTPQGLLVFPESYSTFRLLLRRVEAQLGLSVGWTPHSGRAGYASDSRAEGVPFEEVREQGRWQSDSSLRRYLDIVGASSIGVSLRAAGLAKALEVLATRWTEWVDIEAGVRRLNGRSKLAPTGCSRTAPWSARGPRVPEARRPASHLRDGLGRPRRPPGYYPVRRPWREGESRSVVRRVWSSTLNCPRSSRNSSAVRHMRRPPLM